MKVHLDTDVGGDIDDLCALALLLAWPGVQLTGITTVAEHGGKRAGYAHYAVGLAGRAEVPVCAGADVSLGCYVQPTGLPPEERYWPELIPAAPSNLEDALDLLELSIGEGAVVVAIGPFTNLALLERRRPGALRKVKELILMGGHVFPAPAGFPDWTDEVDYNVQADPSSARLVLESVKCTLITIEVTAQTALQHAHLPALDNGGPLAKLIAHQAREFADYWRNDEQYRQSTSVPRDLINFQHDPLAAAVALGWDGVRIDELPLRFEMDGPFLCARVDPVAGLVHRVVTAVDGRRFNALWTELVSRRSGVGARL
jgi:purine nucleosidase